MTLRQQLIKRDELVLESGMNRKATQIKTRLLRRHIEPYLHLLSLGAKTADLMHLGRSLLSIFRPSRKDPEERETS